MGSSAIRGLAVATETSFGVDPASGYTRVNLANDISFSATVGGFEFQTLKDEFWTDKLIHGSKSASTLTFSIQGHGEGGSVPAPNQLTNILAHCMGGQFYQSVSGASGSSPGATQRTRILSSAYMSDDAIPALMLYSYGSSSPRQVRYVRSRTETGGNYYGNIIGHWLTSSDVATEANQAQATFKLNNVYLDQDNFRFSDSLAFEVFGDDDEDCYRLLGCCGTFSMSVDAGGVPVFNFTFQVADWDRIDKSAANYDFDSNLIYENPYSGPIIANNGEFAWFRYTDETTIGSYGRFHVANFSLDLGTSITRLLATGADNGTANWIKTDVRPSGSFTVYFDDDIHDFISESNANYQLPVYLRVGDATGRIMCIYIQNMILTEQPQRVDIGGITGHQVSFRCGIDKIAQSGSSGVAGSDIIIGFR